MILEGVEPELQHSIVCGYRIWIVPLELTLDLY